MHKMSTAVIRQDMYLLIITGTKIRITEDFKENVKLVLETSQIKIDDQWLIDFASDIVLSYATRAVYCL